MDEQYLKGKIAFITGAYKNLGKAIALTLAEKGADIALNDLSECLTDDSKNELLKEIRNKGVRAFTFDGDISSKKTIDDINDRIQSKLGTVSIVINCAGPFNVDPFIKVKEKQWDLVMDVNLKAVYMTTQVFAPKMRDLGWGRIISMSAGSSKVRNHGVYGLAKAGVRFLTEELALELGPEITVNSISPGQIKESLPIVHKIDPTFGERYIARSPLKKLVSRKDVAELIAFLCSPIADLITGETINIDGGAELPRF